MMNILYVWFPASWGPSVVEAIQTQKSAAPHQSYFVSKLQLTSMVVQKAPRLPRKSSLRCRKCRACHAKECGAPHQSCFVAKLPLTSMLVQKAPRLPRKSSLRCRKCHACHAKDRDATSVLLRRQASLTSVVVQKAPRLPRKSSLTCRKCHACHAKDRGATSVPLRRQASSDLYGGTESTTPATQIEPDRKCHACHAKDRSATSVLLRRQASADLYGGKLLHTCRHLNALERYCDGRHWHLPWGFNKGKWATQFRNCRAYASCFKNYLLATGHVEPSSSLQCSSIFQIWRSGYGWLHLETRIVESAQSIERKFLAQDHRNLTVCKVSCTGRTLAWL